MLRLGGRRSVFFTWILSYGAILGLLAILGVVIHLQASNMLVHQIDRARRATLEQAAGAMDARLVELQRLDLQITWNPRLGSFMTLRSPLAPQDHYTLNLLFRDFLVYRAAYPFIQSFFVYFHDTDVVLSSDTTCRSDLFYDSYMKDLASTYRNWLSLMKRNHEGAFQAFPDAVGYLKSLPSGPSLPMAATLVILLDRSWLTDTLASLAWYDEESIVILDPEGSVLARVGDSQLVAEDLYRQSGKAPKDVLVTAVVSPVSGWTVVSALPKAAFLRPVVSLRIFTLLGLTVFLASGGLLAYRFARRNYQRISEVARDMAALSGIDVNHGNEYTVLKEAVAATLSWKAKLDTDLRQHNATMRQHFLRRLVRGRFADAEELTQSFHDFGIIPLSPYYAVFIVYPEGVRAAGNESDPGRRLASFITAGAVEEIIGRNHRGFVTEHDDMLVCIVSLRLLSALEWTADLDAMIAETRAYLQRNFLPATTVGVSTLVSGAESIPLAYQEALDALEYKLVIGPSTVIRYQDVRDRQSVYRCSPETDQQLYNAVRAGDTERSGEILGVIMERNLRAGEVSIQSLKSFIFDMHNLLTQAVSTVDQERQHDLRMTIHPLMRVLSGDTSLEAVERDVREIVLSVCRSMSGFRKEIRLVCEIREYVESRYADLNLSIGMIADSFHMGQGYLSKLYREATSQSLLDLVTDVRIAHAKALMEKGRASLEDVAGSVGYTSANALIRAFKRHEGITPGRYREVPPPAD
jgi:AraC-like DNA-binding protein